jgi:acetoin utilization deacetylase AcuC-like enzyme
MLLPGVSSLRHWRWWDRGVPIWYDVEYRLPLSSFGQRWALDARRADLVAWYLLEHKWIRPQNLRSPARARYDAIARVHFETYLEQLASPETLAAIFGVDPWDIPVDEVMRTVRLGVGGTIEAARDSLVRRGAAFNLFGGFHHAAPGRGAGLCALNDIAIAIAALRDDGFGGQVVVLDLDAHPPDGTAACLLQDGRSWIGSLSGGASSLIPGADETVLPAGCDDSTYLAALEGLLERMPAPDLAMVVAGGDVLAGDKFGGLGLTVDGVRRRDLRVARLLHGVPSVWLPGGGYHPLSWQLLAGTALAVLWHTRRTIPTDEDPLRTRFARIYRHLDDPRPATHDLSLDDVAADLRLTSRTGHLLLDLYSADRVEYTLYRFGILDFLERRGYSHLRVAIDTASAGGDRVSVFGRAGGDEHLLIDCVAARARVENAGVLYVHWLALRDPLARFSPSRPPLPGQDVPGLGVSREVAELLMLIVERLGLAGMAFKPAWYHMAYVIRKRFQFVAPDVQGRFEAMLRDFASISLIDVSLALAADRVRLNGEPYTWQPETMVWWRDERPRDDDAIAEVRERSRFSIQE